MKHTKVTLVLITILINTLSIFSQNLVMQSDIKTQRFGKDIYYKDQFNNLLNGHYKIADNRGNYSDIHFKNGLKEGKNTEYDYEGRVLKTATYKNGKAEGVYTTYHQNGKIRYTGSFVNGEEHGKWQKFNDEGEILNIEHYDNGKKTGKWWKKIFYGQTQTYGFITENYKNDDYFGYAEERGKDSILKWERNYKNSQTYTHKAYHANEKLYEVKSLKNGKVDGDKITYNQDGIIKSMLRFKDDQLQKATTYFENGNKKEVQHFSNGKRDGVYQLYNKKGIKIEEGTYKNNYKNGIWKTYSTINGQLLSETSFTNDVKNGIAKEFNKANRISAEGFYKNGVKNNTWKHYNLAGKLTKEVVYNLGKEISVKQYK